MANVYTNTFKILVVLTVANKSEHINFLFTVFIISMVIANIKQYIKKLRVVVTMKF